ncbi:RDD family protein [Corynebacterium striatum]
MTPDSFAPDLYEHFDLDRHSTSRELGILLAAKDARLEQMGFEIGDDRRQEAQIAHTILSLPEIRATYDQGLEDQLRPTWPQLSELAAYGEWPFNVQHSFQQPNQQQYGFAPTAQAQQSPFDPFAQPNQASVPAPLASPYTPAASAQERPLASTRAIMAIADIFVCSIITSPVLAFASDTSTFSASFLMGLCAILYCVGFEVVLGGTPVKKLMGYEVRDSTTGEKLSWVQSLKRQWWRAITIVPGLGSVVSFFAAIFYATTIKQENGLLGAHDKLANAEVVKKQR